jgi:hypothetical protein
MFGDGAQPAALLITLFIVECDREDEPIASRQECPFAAMPSRPSHFRG